MTLDDLLAFNHGDLTNRDLATLADWANKKKYLAAHSSWKQAYALLREGADLLQRRRARGIDVQLIDKGENGNGTNHSDTQP